MLFRSQVLQAIQIAVKVITQAIKFIAWVIPKLMAPWTIRSIGRQMQDPFVGKMNDFSESLAVANLESQKSWRSKSGEEFLARAQEQYEQGGKLKNVLYEIRGPVAEEAERLELDGHRILKLNTGNPAVFGFEAPDVIVQDMIAALPFSQGYSTSKGIITARRAVVTRYEVIPGIEDRKSVV